MTAQPKKTYTVEEYLEMELSAPYKSEYYNGEIFPMGEIEGDTPEAMVGALPTHNKISVNLIANLATGIDNKQYYVLGSRQRLFVPEKFFYTYPDIAVYKTPLKYQDERTLTNPVLLVEILSKVTEGYNRGSKFEMYRSIPSLLEYLLVDSQRVHVELWRKESGTWQLAAETNTVDDTIELKSIHNTFSLKDFYFKALEMMERQNSFE